MNSILKQQKCVYRWIGTQTRAKCPVNVLERTVWRLQIPFMLLQTPLTFRPCFWNFLPRTRPPFWQYLFSSLSCMLYWWFGAVIKIKRTSSRYAWYFHILHFKKKLGWPWLFWLILIFLWRKHQFNPINIQTYKNIFIFEGKKKLNFSFIKTLFMPEELIHKSLR